MTVIARLVLLVFVPSLMSVAVMVKLPVVLKATRKDWVPALNAAFAGKVAVEPVVVMPTV